MSDFCLECNLSSCHHLYCHDTVLVSSLKRRVRDLKEQLQRKELHMDLLRRKLAISEDHAKVKCLVIAERDEANCKIRELGKQLDRLHCELNESKHKIRQLNTDLADATHYKIAALERARKIEDLQKILIECDAEKNNVCNQLCQLKEHLHTTNEIYDKEKHNSEHTIVNLKDELHRTRENLMEMSKKEASLHSFKATIAKVLGLVLPVPEVELVSRLQTLVDAHHDFTLVSKKYDDPCLRIANRSPSPCFKHFEPLECEIVKSKNCPFL